MLEQIQPGFQPFYIKNERNYGEMTESPGEGEKAPQDCWTLMTTAEKVLLFLLILALVGIVALASFIIVHFLSEEVCESEECISASFKLLNSIDLSEDPCNDFEKFLCGNYIPISDEKKANLVTAPLSDRDSGPITTLKTFYQSCINSSAIDEDNENTLATIISNIGGWPILMGHTWDEDSFNWQKFMVKVRPLGLKSDWLLHFDYHEDESGINQLLLRPPRIKATSYQFKTDFYQECIINLADRFEANDLALNQLKQMIEFEDRLLQISYLGQDENYTKVSVGRLNEIWPENSLVEILNDLARGYSVFVNSTPIYLDSENYLYELHQLLVSTPKRTQANYFIWSIIETFLPFSSEEIRKIYGKYLKLESREDHCHSETIKRFYSIIKSEEVSKYKHSQTVPLLNLIANLVYESFNETDSEISVIIEGPEGENSGVTDLTFTSDKLPKMITEVQFRIDNEFYKCLHKNPSFCVRENYYEAPREFEPMFDTSDNTFYVPYSLVYSDWFKKNQPNYINFARMGRIIGDQILQAVEDETNTTLSESGINLAYEGYIQWFQKNGMEPKLPALNFTMKQLFWLYSSLGYCSEEEESGKIEEAVDSLYFKEDFHCI
ncbi:neprilysin-2 [Tribolium castaneum]|uniref:Endothelin-converting enzyme 2-like Protein n=1 Tax=Tribolium castaneum TaxID=7070 RepID=D6WPW2_TRICA|nr:PREDICTED: endothelin-converting enzyme 1 [Tribolium castaneum]EFA06165.2 Endothelin-converting enzyme 2-like Protein [Tribolium castaneum]|eukprot:XP_001812679.1 PREDICTED: endothelin-converting enzyme 1 [Tribolium castaneum]